MVGVNELYRVHHNRYALVYGISGRRAMKEIWKPVIGWTSYQVSNLGRARGSRGILSLFVIKNYMAFNVVDREKRKSLRLHREVLRAFTGKHNGFIVCHHDGNCRNNKLGNLKWGTHGENEEDKKRHKRNLAGERHHQCKLTKSCVKTIRESGLSGVKLARFFKVSPSTICSIRKIRTWK